jgi:radical SAM superfamily enzyme YgiQ (UPF0313 family)
MDILLINPPQIPLKDFNITTALRMGYPAYPPMGLGYLTSAVKKDGRHHVELYDNHLDGMLKIVNRESDSISTFKECLKNKLRSVKPDVIGLTIMFSVIYDNLIECLACIKEMHPDAVIVIGGAHASMAPESLYNVKEIDYVLSYEAEETLIGFLDYLDGTGSIDDIQALHYRENGNFKANSFLSRETDLDKRQYPDWDSLALDKYCKTGRFGGAYAIGDYANKPCAPLLTSRGCRADCAFCTVHKIMGRKVRMRTPEKVVDEIEHLVKNYGVSFFEILDDDFTYNRKRSMEICREIVRRKLEIVWTAKNGLIACSLDRELIEVMAESGCRYIQIGVESGNEEILKWIRKPLSIPKLLKVREIFRDFPEIYLAGYFVLGFPHETKEMMRDTYDLAIKLGLDWSAITMAQPLPNSRMYEDFVCEGLLKEDEINYGDLTFFHNTMGNKYCTMREILDMWYEFNIGVNFINNPNLNGGNLDRAIRDFYHIGCELVPGHAMAMYCLSKAYEKKGDKGNFKKYFAEAASIVNKDAEWQKWFKHFNLSV